ncbi:oxoglutarate iron-dependent oxygenase [Phialemonium atrogriseum]|uniref:Oxoglutarate iron-dependent oxygenase n=1 Tax=Phialemonium atrogriseum TaxID=1093897 RepID=A0AAJ0C0F9_9PEZI|nr:oxoglutarate iron-dependent oxygenase [Phialemonium atrogriseum]KAK1767870.1 oxoglutarate iron-dependent oxygenase [Phialemonium atrogriseum]
MSLDPSRGGAQRALMSRLSPVESRHVTEMGRLGKWVYCKSVLETATDASGNIPWPIYKPEWPNLESLALTSQLLHPTAERRSVNDLVQAAAGAAMERPKLQTMEIWNGESGFACIFRYRRAGTDGCPTITLSSTWGHRLESRVPRAWDDVANKRASRDILVEVRALAGEDFKSHGSVVGLLELRRRVQHPVSLRQVRWEGEHC